MNDCIFCQFVNNEMDHHRVWEDENHIAFLTPFANTAGVTVVIPREHLNSYVFENTPDQIASLMSAAQQVAKKIDAAFDDVGRTGVIFEGFGIDHLHAKLFPMHGTADMSSWQPIEESKDEYYEVYPGYLSSHDAGQRPDHEIQQAANMIKEA